MLLRSLKLVVTLKLEAKKKKLNQLQTYLNLIKTHIAHQLDDFCIFFFG